MPLRRGYPPQPSWVAHIPGPPGPLPPPIWLWQQTSPASQPPCIPAVHSHPTPVHAAPQWPSFPQ